jgi:hypothetical protein
MQNAGNEIRRKHDELAIEFAGNSMHFMAKFAGNWKTARTHEDLHPWISRKFRRFQKLKLSISTCRSCIIHQQSINISSRNQQTRMDRREEESHMKL